ncbi:MAG: shikimate kinase [Candidatus Methanoplasma sp.]|jgi:shikimate kinase|nr:shikimate kinase [Candidatus Methanoplasma sp.]
MGKGVSYGAISVINAMPCGIGSTIGVSLKTTSRFEYGDDLIEKKVAITNDPSENTEMARICVSETYNKMGLPEPFGWKLDISSEIPISRGLKSSSSACNAIISSVLNSEGFDMPAIDRIRLGVDCARKAKVTVTGAFDDACGCELGGLVITDNRQDSVLFRKDIGEYDVVIHVPSEKIKKTGLPIEELRSISSEIEPLIELAKTDPFKAMTLNGRLIASVSGIDNSLSELAIGNGALGAGVSGSGPAVAMILEKGRAKEFIHRVHINDIIVTKTRGIQE